MVQFKSLFLSMFIHIYQQKVHISIAFSLCIELDTTVLYRLTQTNTLQVVLGLLQENAQF